MKMMAQLYAICKRLPLDPKTQMVESTRLKKTFNTNSNQERAWVALPISDK